MACTALVKVLAVLGAVVGALAIVYAAAFALFLLWVRLTNTD